MAKVGKMVEVAIVANLAKCCKNGKNGKRCESGEIRKYYTCGERGEFQREGSRATVAKVANLSKLWDSKGGAFRNVTVGKSS